MNWGTSYTDNNGWNVVDFLVFHKLNLNRFQPLLFTAMSALPFAAGAARECNRATPVPQFCIQQPWQHFLWVHNQSAHSYCVIIQKVEPWDLIWTSSAALSTLFRTKLRANTYLSIKDENNNQTECGAFLRCIEFLSTATFFWAIVPSSVCYIAVIL